MPRLFIKFSLITMVDLAGVPFACWAWPGTMGIAAAATAARGGIWFRQSPWLLREWPGRPQNLHTYLGLVKRDESISYRLSSWSCLCSRSTSASASLTSRTASSSSSSGHHDIKCYEVKMVDKATVPRSRMSMFNLSHQKASNDSLAFGDDESSLFVSMFITVY